MVKAPAPSDVNSGLTSCDWRVLKALFGMPRDVLGSECQEVTNAELRSLCGVVQVGQFRIYGNVVMLSELQKGLSACYVKEPSLWNQLGTAGCMCARLVRGSDSTPSNHSWGTALDFTVGGRLDVRGDGYCQRGVLRLYDFLHPLGFFWGGGYRTTEDAMHYELATETVLRLALAGRWGEAVRLRAVKI